MIRLFISCFVFLTLANCTKRNESETHAIELSLYESYNLIELSTSFNEANKLIRKYLLDSIAKIKTGSILLDAINKESAKDDSIRTIEDFPLFSVFIPNTKTSQNGEAYMDTSTILGWTTDTLTLNSYINLSQKVFPEGITWITSRGFSNKYLCLHALKNINKVLLKENDIDSIIIEPTGPNSFGGVFEKISDLKGISKYRTALKLNSRLSNILEMNSYTLILKLNSVEYSGSIVDFKKFPGQYIFIGEMTTTDFQILKNNLESKMKIRK